MYNYRNWLKIVLVSAFVLFTNYGFIDRIALLVAQGRLGTIAGFLLVWVLALAAILVAAFQPRWFWRMGWALILAATTAGGVGYFAISGSDFTVFDFVSLWNARHEAGRAADFYGHQLFLSAGLVFVAGLLAIGFPAPLRSAGARRWLNRLALLPVLPFLAIAVIVAMKAGGGQQALPKQFTPLSVAAVAASRIATQENYVRNQVAWTPDPQKRVKNILFLVDESIRADYLDFTAGNPFTPNLAKLKTNFVDFGPAASGGNCSHYSNVILRSGARRDDLTVSVNESPYIWTYAKKAGYRTIFVDAQGAIVKNPGRLTNFMTVAETRDIDRYVSLNYGDPEQADFELLKLIAEETKGDQPVFIYANKNGAHFPYDASYPKDQAKFGPTMTESGSEDTIHRMASYRNSIAWSVDQFFVSFFKDLDLSNLALVYTADHGQALEKGALTHCAIENPDPRQGLVPLLAFASDPDLRERLEVGARAGYQRASHFTIVPAVLEMMGYRGSDVAQYYSESMLTAPKGDPAFTSGDIFGMFSKQVLWHPIDLTRDYREPESLALRPRSSAASMSVSQ
ncbi:sulfatase-like hydrolase/transferase [Nordella sp. HKS 07]|uniref:sulfatase-like hydrolase/transferase n=1 Tax=Nordella sp. HKS 07 TaxID=2712222 RepID=UPI0013E177FF|nr:sulfatase-like hydrolase/transferase [Nordella sp. HKS 07]QIG50292.1 sulfatase-like hydrolase/transferase [Nordella sp. HKS 07]